MGTVAGQRWLAARVDVPPAWHVYWENPGDSGLPTRATIDAPGWRLGEARYPGPERISAPGGLDNAPNGQVESGPYTAYVHLALTELLAGKPITTPRPRNYGCSVKYAG